MGSYEYEKQETRKKIIRAFWEIYRNKNIEKITVKNITDACGIYRTTFYLHFTDVYAILEELEEEFFGHLTAISRQMDKTQYMNAFRMLYINDGEYLRILLDEQRNPEFAKKYKQEFISRICWFYDIDLKKLAPKDAMVVQKTFSLMLDMIFCWEEAELFSMEELLEILDGYLERGIVKTINEKMEK